MFHLTTIFQVYGLPNSETCLSKLSQSFPVVNTTLEAIRVQFLTRKLVIAIIPIACEGIRSVEAQSYWFSSLVLLLSTDGVVVPPQG